MKNTKEVEFELEGVSPLKMDRWVDDQPNMKTQEEYKKAAIDKAYRDEKGNLAIPSTAIKAAMRLASSEIGKKIEAKKNRQSISAGVFLDGEYVTILNEKGKPKKDYDCIVGDVVARGQGTKLTRVVTYRPLVRQWKVKGKLSIIPLTLTMDSIRQSLENAGLRYGLLSHRPEFGRFVVNKFLEVK